LGIRIEESWPQLGRADAWWNEKAKAKPTPFHSWVIQVEMQKILSRIFVVNLSGGNRDAYASAGILCS